jgi:hypothetical protein
MSWPSGHRANLVEITAMMFILSYVAKWEFLHEEKGVDHLNFNDLSHFSCTSMHYDINNLNFPFWQQNCVPNWIKQCHCHWMFVCSDITANKANRKNKPLKIVLTYFQPIKYACK